MYGDEQGYLDAKQELGSHQLLPYIDYYYLKRNFDNVDKKLVENYISRYPHSPMANRLRTTWLKKLAKEQRWDKLIALYQPSKSTHLQCLYLNALQKTGRAQQADDLVELIWLTGRSQPDACDEVFITWLKENPKKSTLVWRRFQESLKKYNFKLAKHLTKQMNDKQAKEAMAIIKLYSNPNLVTQSSYLRSQPSPEVVSYGIARLSRRSPATAISTYNKLRKKYAFNKEQKKRIFQSIALKYSMRKNVRANAWFRKIVGHDLDTVYQEWMIRSALIHKDWQLVKDSINGLPEEERNTPRWQYWYARALDKLGDNEKASEIFKKLAKIRSYHGFLASQFVNESIHVKHEIPDISSQDIEQVEGLAAYKRAKLLYQMNHKNDARLELYYLMKHSSMKQQYIITKLVSKWGWHSQVLRLSRYSKHKDDINLRFPFGFSKSVTKQASIRELDPALVYAIIRQESYFTPHANSHAGAVGLMQLMPQTAYRTSKQFKFKYSGRKDLLHGETNIKFGVAHLKKLHEQFGDQPILVIAAYNAGKRAVKRWLPKTKNDIPADIWVETVPFYETRKYIKNVIASHVVYQHRMGKPPQLKPLMKRVKNNAI